METRLVDQLPENRGGPRRVDEGNGAVPDHPGRREGQNWDFFGGVDNPPLDGDPRIIERDMLSSAKVERALRTMFDHRPERSRAVPRSDPNVAKAGAPRRIGGGLSDRIARKALKRRKPLAGEAWRIGAGQEDRVHLVPIRRLPFDRPHMKKRCGGGREPQGGRSGCGRVGPRLWSQDQEN